MKVMTHRYYSHISNLLFLTIIFITVIFSIVNEIATLPRCKSLCRNDLALIDSRKTQTKAVDVLAETNKIKFPEKKRDRKSDTNHKSQRGISHNFFIFPPVRDHEEYSHVKRGRRTSALRLRSFQNEKLCSSWNSGMAFIPLKQLR